MKKKSAAAIDDVGPLRSVQFQSEKADATDGYTLTITYALRFEKKDLTANVDFRFGGFKGGVSGYEVVALEKTGRGDGK